MRRRSLRERHTTSVRLEALAGLHQYDQAYQLANASLARLEGTRYDGHKSQVYINRGSVNRDRGDWGAAIPDYQHAIKLSSRIDNFRGVTDAGGLLAPPYLHTGDLPAALAAINAAIDANTKIPDELYLVPRNLAIKADITARLGDARASNVLYQKSITLVEGMIQHAATTDIQRYLVAEMSDVYSGYFATLCSQHHYDEALQALERVRGRIEAEALEHHVSQPVHAPTPAEEELTRLNLTHGKDSCSIVTPAASYCSKTGCLDSSS